MPLTPLEKWKRIKAGLDIILEKDSKIVKDGYSYKRPEVPCDHPPDRRTIEEGRFGNYRICLDCGRILNDEE
jgi:hypothetical protein